MLTDLAQPAVSAPVLPGAGRSSQGLTPLGWSRESEATGDLDHDGRPDIALIVVSPDGEHRMLSVARGAPVGYRRVGQASLPTDPLGPASLSFSSKGVLVVTDLVGGTTATQAVYRFRYDPATGRMRLIGLDATRYSRTNQHDAVKLSINYLTGQRVDQIDRLTSAGDYDPQPQRRRKGRPAVLYMEDTPDPDSLLGLTEH